MQLSPEETKYILPGRTAQEKEKVELYLAGHKLERAPQCHVKMLGIPIHEDGGAATWPKELEPTWKKLLHLVKRISQKRGGADTNTARTLTSAVLTSRACYGAVCFDLTKAQYSKLERMQRECLRVITGLPRHARVEDLHRTKPPCHVVHLVVSLRDKTGGGAGYNDDDASHAQDPVQQRASRRQRALPPETPGQLTMTSSQITTEVPTPPTATYQNPLSRHAFHGPPKLFATFGSNSTEGVCKIVRCVVHEKMEQLYGVRQPMVGASSPV
ncbi:hypothetical protein HPB49_024758 [Dermacentor silvarum]|uniref:Uncharacterized protein n=1 Tax=Dermacentor silvarum TaxID=543639 RepID=A0ACB8D996_DERSI|nr:hypothetical protein HPB49_024758 [Dermacentor silvarum]